MAQTHLVDHQLVVVHMSYSGSIWANTLHIKDTGAGVLDGTGAVYANIKDFFQGMTPNAGFLESITGYEVWQTHTGDFVPERPPIFQNTYHAAGTHDANFNGSPIGAALPKDVVVFSKLSTSGGRSGKLFIRNLLEESDVDSAVSGSWEFSAGSTRFTVGRFATLVAGTIADNFPGGANAAQHQIVVAHLLNVSNIDTRAPFSTPVTAVTALRPTWNKAHR